MMNIYLDDLVSISRYPEENILHETFAQVNITNHQKAICLAEGSERTSPMEQIVANHLNEIQILQTTTAYTLELQLKHSTSGNCSSI